MNTKNKHSEHTANVAMSQAPAIVAKIGRNFAKPIPRIVRENKKSFLQKLFKLWYNKGLEGNKRNRNTVNLGYRNNLDLLRKDR